MASKRSRATFEADLQKQQSPFVTYGTPLPPLDPEVRDDGSYMPIWKQEVTDEQGRKRLHGAFTGGFSAGYFNTVGSKEGWTPTTFISSRTNRRKDDQKRIQQRPEDFMDEEDLAEAAEAQALRTSESFAGLGSTSEDGKRKGLLTELFRVEGETMGIKLLRKMGWRDGQGIGPPTRRSARLDDGAGPSKEADETHLFAPANSALILFTKKDDRKGLGFHEETPFTKISSVHVLGYDVDDDFGTGNNLSAFPLSSPTTQPSHNRGGIGIGVLNDVSDDEDPYTIGPKISYSKVISGGKKKTINKVQPSKAAPRLANPLLKDKPVFLSKTSLQPKPGFRKCFDGRLPLDGFVLSRSPSALTVDTDYRNKYPRPQIPAGWKSSKVVSQKDVENPGYQTTAEAAKLNKLDPKARAAILDEKQLPGKSVFDYLSPAARSRLVSASGKNNLPAALNEAPAKDIALVDEKNGARVDPSQLPELDKETALAALGRGVGGWMPYAEDDAKRSRYRMFLECCGGLRQNIPDQPAGVTKEFWLQELREFAHAAEVFKPMTGTMASRFTSSSTLPTSSSGETTVPIQPLVAKPSASSKPEDPAEAAAKMGMFGPITRSVHTFYPSRLVCKRFNVKPPPHVQPDVDSVASADSQSKGYETISTSLGSAAGSEMVAQVSPSTAITLTSSTVNSRERLDGPTGDGLAPKPLLSTEVAEETIMDPTKNDALEGQKADEALFKAVFGSDDEGYAET